MNITRFIAVSAATTLTASCVAFADEPITDPVTFHAQDYACLFSIDGRPEGRIDPSQPKTINLKRGSEYLIECESHDIPVKLYARSHVFPHGDFQSGPLNTEVTLLPVAVLPNAMKAAAAKKLVVTSVVDSKSVGCSSGPHDPREPWQDNSRQVAPRTRHTIPKGTVVEVSNSPFKHCGDTNLIEVRGDAWTDWFKNRDFEFSFKGKRIELYPMSQDYDCCWIS